LQVALRPPRHQWRWRVAPDGDGLTSGRWRNALFTPKQQQ
jgi:hypothetical protein